MSGTLVIVPLSQPCLYSVVRCVEAKDDHTVPVSLPASRALYSSLAASSSRWILEAFSSDS